MRSTHSQRVGVVLCALCVVVTPLTLACEGEPGEGEPCRRVSGSDFAGGGVRVSCAGDLVCDRTLCLPPDGPEAPRRFGDFEAVYQPGTSQRLFESGGGPPVLVLENDPFVFVDARVAVARTPWRVFRIGGDTLRLPALEADGVFPPLATDPYLLAGNEEGDVAVAADEGIVVARDDPNPGFVTGFLPTDTVHEVGANAFDIAIEPGALVIMLRDGQLSSPNGRTLLPHEPLSGLHRPYGGPTLVWVDPNDATSPTRVMILAEDGSIIPLVTLPDQLDSVGSLDAHDGHLYVAETGWGLFRSIAPLPELVR